ncbi:MAG TPA: hypothetical protein VF380_02290, partial [Solirubrobacteraceae bacterium]
MAALTRTPVPARAAALAAVLTTVLAATLWLALAGGGASHVAAPRGAASHATLASLPVGAQGPVSAALGAADPAYRVLPVAGGLRASTPAQGLRTDFTGSGVQLTAGASHVGLSVSGLGYGDAIATVGAATPTAAANRVTYAHPGLTEWYANGPLGLEQGFTVPQPTSTPAAGALTVAMTLSGARHASLAQGGGQLLLSSGPGDVLRYGGLQATDARGRVLHTWMQLRSGELLLRVDATGASYPLSIDPLVSGERIMGTEEKEGGYFGRNVAMTPDGNTAIIGGPRDATNSGAAWVFTRSDKGVWSQQGPKLTGGEEAGKGGFGQSAAISADGNTAIIGGEDDNGEAGAAWVFA